MLRLVLQRLSKMLEGKCTRRPIGLWLRYFASQVLLLPPSTITSFMMTGGSFFQSSPLERAVPWLPLTSPSYVLFSTANSGLYRWQPSFRYTLRLRDSLCIAASRLQSL